MARKDKYTRDNESKDETRDRKRDRDGWKAARTAARRNKVRRRDYEQGE